MKRHLEDSLSAAAALLVLFTAMLDPWMSLTLALIFLAILALVYWSPWQRASP